MYNSPGGIFTDGEVLKAYKNYYILVIDTCK
jgi:hypothetical protein